MPRIQLSYHIFISGLNLNVPELTCDNIQLLNLSKVAVSKAAQDDNLLVTVATKINQSPVQNWLLFMKTTLGCTTNVICTIVHTWWRQHNASSWRAPASSPPYASTGCHHTPRWSRHTRPRRGSCGIGRPGSAWCRQSPLGGQKSYSKLIIPSLHGADFGSYWQCFLHAIVYVIYRFSPCVIVDILATPMDFAN